MSGYWSQYLEVDLSTQSVQIKPIPIRVSEKYLGGRGLGAYLYLQYAPDPNVDPLGGDNPVILAVGPLTGTPVSGSGRASATTRSPLTNTLLDTNAGGMFGPFFTFTGYDALVIKGQAERPVMVHISDKGVELLDAQALWGLSTQDTTQVLNKEYFQGASILSIGQASENGVLYGSVCVDGHRFFGRGGLGSVWASKKLKAIAVKGTKRPEIANKEAFDAANYELIKVMKANPITSKVLPALGTNALMEVINFFGMLPTRNFQEGVFEGIQKVDGEAIADTLLKKQSGCWGCVIRCGRRTEANGISGDGPEYETNWALGPNLGIDDLGLITQANYLCNAYGMDSITAGGSISYAMEATERGLHDFGIRFGEKEKLIGMIHKIATCQDVGKFLAMGSKRLSDQFGGTEFAMNVKGMELAAYDPRGSMGMGVGYATSNRGACHLRGGYSVGYEELGTPRRINRLAVSGKGTHVARSQDIGAFYDSAVVCRFNSYAVSMDIWARILNAVSGTDYTSAEVEAIGARVHNLERLINLKLGFSKNDDTLPKRLLTEPLKEGLSKGRTVPLEEMLQEYYDYRGWNDQGIPTPTTIERFQLKEDVPWL